MIGKPGPFQIIESESIAALDLPMAGPRRRYECQNYETCLDLAAALNWDNFTCRGCSREIDERLLWRGHQEIKKDSVAEEICELPAIKARLVVEKPQPSISQGWKEALGE